MWVTVVLRDITESRNMSIHIHWIQNQWSYDTKQHSVWWQHSALGVTIYALSLISSLQFGAFTELRIQWLYQEHVHFFVTFPVLLSNITNPTKPPTPTTPYIATPSNLSTPTHHTALPPAQPPPPKKNEKNRIRPISCLWMIWYLFFHKEWVQLPVLPQCYEFIPSLGPV